MLEKGWNVVTAMMLQKMYARQGYITKGQRDTTEKLAYSVQLLIL